MKQALCTLAILLLLPILLTGCENGEVESSALFEKTSNYDSTITDLSSGELQLSNNVSLSESELYYQHRYQITKDNYIARNGDWIFYIYNDGAIVRMKADKSEQVAIVKEMKCSSVFLLGEVLYFLSDIDSSIYACDLDGDNIVKIVPGKVESFTVTGKFLYYLNEDFHLYMTNLDGTNQNRITDFLTSGVDITEDKIVYYDLFAEDLYTASLEGENPQIFLPNRYHSVYKNKIYYYDSLGYEEKIVDGELVREVPISIYSTDLNTGESKPIVETFSEYGIDSLAFWEDFLIYTSGKGIYVCSLEGGEPQLIMEDNSLIEPIRVLGEYVYYWSSEPDTSFARLECVNLEILEKSTVVEINIFDEILPTDEYLFFIDKRDRNIYRTEPDGSNLYRLTDAECYSLYHHNDKLYYGGYANGYNSELSVTASEAEAYGFFELDKEGQGSVLIKEDEAFPDFLHEGYAYRSGFGSEASIYRFSLDEIEDFSEDKPFIKENDGSSIQGSHLIIDEWIYASYVNPSEKDLIGLIKMRLDGSEKQKVLNEFIDQAQWHDGKIYYTGLYSIAHEAGINDMQLWRMNPDGTENEMLLQLDSVIGKYQIADGAVYYLDPEYDYIYKLDLSSREKTQLTDVPCTDFAVSKGGIYFSNAYDRGAIYLMSKDGEFPHKIVDPDDEWRDLSDRQVTGLK